MEAVSNFLYPAMQEDYRQSWGSYFGKVTSY